MSKEMRHLTLFIYDDHDIWIWSAYEEFGTIFAKYEQETEAFNTAEEALDDFKLFIAKENFGPWQWADNSPYKGIEQVDIDPNQGMLF